MDKDKRKQWMGGWKERKTEWMEQMTSWMHSLGKKNPDGRTERVNGWMD